MLKLIIFSLFVIISVNNVDAGKYNEYAIFIPSGIYNIKRTSKPKLVSDGVIIKEYDSTYDNVKDFTLKVIEDYFLEDELCIGHGMLNFKKIRNFKKIKNIELCKKKILDNLEIESSGDLISVILFKQTRFSFYQKNGGRSGIKNFYKKYKCGRKDLYQNHMNYKAIFVFENDAYFYSKIKDNSIIKCKGNFFAKCFYLGLDIKYVFLCSGKKYNNIKSQLFIIKNLISFHDTEDRFYEDLDLDTSSGNDENLDEAYEDLYMNYPIDDQYMIYKAPIERFEDDKKKIKELIIKNDTNRHLLFYKGWTEKLSEYIKKSPFKFNIYSYLKKDIIMSNIPEYIKKGLFSFEFEIKSIVINYLNEPNELIDY